MDTGWLIAIIYFGLISSGFFSGMETGLISLNRVRLRHEVERKNRRAILITGFVEDSERLLGTTLAGTNVCNVLVAVAAAALAARWFGPGFGVDLGATLVTSALVLILAEIVPKLLFRQYSHRLCLTFADLLNFAGWLLAPVVWTIRGLMRLVAHLTGRRDDKPASFFVTREELKHLAKESEAGGALTADERQMIHGVFDFPYKTVQEIMVPLARTVTIGPGASLDELFELSNTTGYARIPVRDGDIITGIANVYEILFENAPRAGRTVREFQQPPQFVHGADRVNRVLPILRARRNPISVVLDPANRPLGILTIEDIVEEIVGDVEG
jgi:CBS domain containing-hemolysin-like protein